MAVSFASVVINVAHGGQVPCLHAIVRVDSKRAVGRRALEIEAEPITSERQDKRTFPGDIPEVFAHGVRVDRGVGETVRDGLRSTVAREGSGVASAMHGLAATIGEEMVGVIHLQNERVILPRTQIRYRGKRSPVCPGARVETLQVTEAGRAVILSGRLRGADDDVVVGAVDEPFRRPGVVRRVGHGSASERDIGGGPIDEIRAPGQPEGPAGSGERIGVDRDKLVPVANDRGIPREVGQHRLPVKPLPIQAVGAHSYGQCLVKIWRHAKSVAGARADENSRPAENCFGQQNNEGNLENRLGHEPIPSGLTENRRHARVAPQNKVAVVWLGLKASRQADLSGAARLRKQKRREEPARLEVRPIFDLC